MQVPKLSHTTTFPRTVIIENVHPEIDGGRFAIKRVGGERVEVTADIFTDGHDVASNDYQNLNRISGEIDELGIEIPWKLVLFKA